MALMTGEEYIESIRKINMEVYMFGKKVDSPVDDPILRPSLNSVRMTYDLAQMPEYEDLMTVTLEDGRKIKGCSDSRRLRASSAALVWTRSMRSTARRLKRIKHAARTITRIF